MMKMILLIAITFGQAVYALPGDFSASMEKLINCSRATSRSGLLVDSWLNVHRTGGETKEFSFIGERKGKKGIWYFSESKFRNAVFYPFSLDEINFSNMPHKGDWKNFCFDSPEWKEESKTLEDKKISVCGMFYAQRGVLSIANTSLQEDEKKVSRNTIKLTTRREDTSVAELLDAWKKGMRSALENRISSEVEASYGELITEVAKNGKKTNRDSMAKGTSSALEDIYRMAEKDCLPDKNNDDLGLGPSLAILKQGLQEVKARLRHKITGSDVVSPAGSH